MALLAGLRNNYVCIGRKNIYHNALVSNLSNK